VTDHPSQSATTAVAGSSPSHGSALVDADRGRLSGLFGPVVTNFRDDESLDLDAFAANLRAHLAAGLDGILVTGSTGEAALVDEGERERLLAMAREVVPADRWLLAGVGGESTRQVVQRCRVASALGVDVALVVAPHYYGPQMTHAALDGHYRRVADESPIPVALYNIPKYMHFSLPPELVGELAGHPNVIGMKDSSGDAALFGRYLEARSSSFGVLTGNGSGFAAALAAGADGGTLAVSLFASALACAVRDAARSGDPAAAMALQSRLAVANGAIVAALGVPGVKAALDLVGLRGGSCRSPLQALDRTGRETVRAALAAAGVLEPAATAS
jgi:4-hydroxy-2-oxoglutarate aldolase